MAIAFDASSSGSGAGTVTVSHTCTGSNLVLYARTLEHFNTAITGVTYNSVAMTNIASQSQGANNVTAKLWRLIGPATGAHNVVVSQSASHNIVVVSSSFTGVDQTTPEGSPVTASGASTTPSVTVVSATSEIVIDAVAGEDNVGTMTGSVSGGQTSDGNVNLFAGGVGVLGLGSHLTGATSTVMSWTLSTSANWAAIAVAVKPVSGSPTVVPKLSLMGVG